MTDHYFESKVSPFDIAICLWVGLVLLYLGLCIIPEKKDGAKEQREIIEYTEPSPKKYTPTNQRTFKSSNTPSPSSENKLIDHLNNVDFYDYSDYNRGLDGVHSDIDFAEVEEYFRD